MLFEETKCPKDNTSSIICYDKTETIHLHSKDTYKLREALLVISGLSHALGKNYRVICEEAHLFQRYEISESEKKQERKALNIFLKKHFRKWDVIDRDQCEKIKKVYDQIENGNLLRYTDNGKDFINFLSSYEFNLIEDIERKKITYTVYNGGFFGEDYRVSCDVFDTSITGELIITPAYFFKFFNTYADCFERIKNKKEVSVIAEKLSENLIKSTKESVEFGYATINIHKNGCFHDYTTTKNGYCENVYFGIRYNDLGMNVISDERLLFAVCIAVIAETIKLTEKADCPYDLVPDMFRSVYWHHDPPGISFKHNCMINVDLKPVKNVVIHYNEW